VLEIKASLPGFAELWINVYSRAVNMEGDAGWILPEESEVVFFTSLSSVANSSFDASFLL